MWKHMGALALLLLSATAAAQDLQPEEIRFAGKAKGKPVELRGKLFVGVKAPQPAMVIVHGSGGVSDTREYAYARELNAMGVAAFVGDHFGGRGVKSTVEDQAAVPGLQMTEDAFAIVALLARHPRLDPARIGIMGFSKGGTVTMNTALQRYRQRFAPDGPRFALHVAFYPSCDSQARDLQTTGAPIRVLMGGADTYVGVAPCLDYVSAIQAGGGDIRATVYPDAEHGWDGARRFDNPRGENYSKCVFKEQPDGTWTEMVSGVRTNDARGVRIPDGYAAALRACRTLGVRGGPNSRVKVQALADLKAFIASAFGL